MTFRRKRILWVGSGLFVAAVIFFCFTKPSSPEGSYLSSENIGAVGDWYMEFANGKVSWVLHEEKNHTYREVYGDYLKKGDGWIFVSRGKAATNTAKNECLWSGLRLYNEDGSCEFMRRRFIPGRRPDWMLDRLPWWVQ